LRFAAALIVLTLVFQSGSLFAGGQKEPARPTMISISKYTGPWLERLEAGLKKAGVELGVDVIQQAPAAGNATDRQGRTIDDAINRGPNAILVVPDTAKAIEPALGRARSRKIAIVSHLSPDLVGADVDIEMTDSRSFGERALEEMVTAMGSPAGEYAVYVGSFTRADHNLWADAAIALARREYPGLSLIGYRFPVSDDQALARRFSLELIAAHPGLKAFLAFGGQGGLGAAQAVREMGLIGNVAVVSTSSPSRALPYLKDGSLSACVLWDPAEAGYAMVYLAKLVLDGKKGMIGPDLDIPTLGTPLAFKGNTLVYDRPLVLTRENVDDYSGF